MAGSIRVFVGNGRYSIARKGCGMLRHFQLGVNAKVNEKPCLPERVGTVDDESTAATEDRLPGRKSC